MGEKELIIKIGDGPVMQLPLKSYYVSALLKDLYELMGELENAEAEGHKGEGV